MRRQSMATLRRLREVPRHLLVCEKSNFGHDKSRHRHLVETHYHNYRVSPAATGPPIQAPSSPAGEVWGDPRFARREGPALVRGGAGPLAGHAERCSLLTAPNW